MGERRGRDGTCLPAVGLAGSVGGQRWRCVWQAVPAGRVAGRWEVKQVGGPLAASGEACVRGREVACSLPPDPCRPVHLGTRGQLAVPPDLSPASGASCLSPDVTLPVSSPGGPRAGLGCPRPCPALASGLRCTGSPAVAPVLTALPLHTPPPHPGPRDAVLLVLSLASWFTALLFPFSVLNRLLALSGDFLPGPCALVPPAT